MLGVRMALGVVCAMGLSPVALAWDAAGHRTITLLALDGVSAATASDSDRAMLSWLLSETGRKQSAYAAAEPDRYRAIGPPVGLYLAHEVNPDHYIDVDDLSQFGLTLSTVPPLRNEYLRAMMIAKHVHPEGVKPYNEKLDPARQQEWPGFLPHAMVEHYAKLVSAMRQVRVLEKLNDPARHLQLEAARAYVIVEVGQLSHFVGDAAQPLHTTMHHHGWIGENPNGYTTDRGFHAYIDGTILTIHQLNRDTLAADVQARVQPGMPADSPVRQIDKDNPWNDVIAHIERSYVQVEPLYVLKKTGELEKDAGKAFIAERLRDAGSMLGGMIVGAWQVSAPSEKDVTSFVGYDAEAKLPQTEPSPVRTESPAEQPPPKPAQP